MNRTIIIIIIVFALGFYFGGTNMLDNPKKCFPTVDYTKYNGVYFGNGIFACKSEETCLHELGHAVDEFMDFPSHTQEFADVLDSFCEIEAHPACELPGINSNPLAGWGGYTEAYAEVYKYWKLWGHLPKELSSFYGVVYAD